MARGETKPLVELQEGMLVLDDSTLDKPYAQQMDLVTYHWSGKHQSVVKGINLLSLLWTDGEARLPCDFRIYNKKKDGLTKNDHFRAMLQEAKQRGFEPELVAFDSWYASLQIQTIHIPRHGQRVHLKGYGWVKVFQTVGKNGDAEYWASSDLEMTLEDAAENNFIHVRPRPPSLTRLYTISSRLIQKHHKRKVVLKMARPFV